VGAETSENSDVSAKLKFKIVSSKIWRISLMRINGTVHGDL
jgi:hypothetical protein